MLKLLVEIKVNKNGQIQLWYLLYFFIMEYILISAFPHSPQIYFFNLFHFTIIILYIVQRYETKCSSGTSYPSAGWSRSIEIRDHKIPRRDDNVALKALRATTDRVATLSGGSPAYAGPDCFYCRFWCRRLGQKRVGLGSLRWQPSNLPSGPLSSASAAAGKQQLRESVRV